jgi:hypothetical protein
VLEVVLLVALLVESVMLDGSVVVLEGVLESVELMVGSEVVVVSSV